MASRSGGGSVLVPMIFIFAGYTVMSWGWILIKGYDISLRQWVSPLHPYQWPASGNPPPAQATRVFPAGVSAASGSTTSGG